jgi:NAD(P)-dependent dehydrogenase (short-subunit alcohol dehydrogenase family)
MNNLEGKVAAITGGNSGIGLVPEQRFVSDSACPNTFIHYN